PPSRPELPSAHHERSPAIDGDREHCIGQIDRVSEGRVRSLGTALGCEGRWRRPKNRSERQEPARRNSGERSPASAKHSGTSLETRGSGRPTSEGSATQTSASMPAYDTERTCGTSIIVMTTPLRAWRPGPRARPAGLPWGFGRARGRAA